MFQQYVLSMNLFLTDISMNLFLTNIDVNLVLLDIGDKLKSGVQVSERYTADLKERVILHKIIKKWRNNRFKRKRYLRDR